MQNYSIYADKNIYFFECFLIFQNERRSGYIVADPGSGAFLLPRTGIDKG
jgi:hypothetical protein